ncbi:hypothetical protein D3C83_118680 [compost metagenome]
MDRAPRIVLLEPHQDLIAVADKFERRRRDHDQRHAFGPAMQQIVVERIPLGDDGPRRVIERIAALEHRKGRPVGHVC